MLVTVPPQLQPTALKMHTLCQEQKVPAPFTSHLKTETEEDTVFLIVCAYLNMIAFSSFQKS